jgi:hypothetical protein
MKAFVVALILFMLLNPAYDVKVKPVSTDPYYKWWLDLYEDIAVWHEIKEYERGEVKKSDIVIHNLTTGREQVIDKGRPMLTPAIWGDHVLYTEVVDSNYYNLWLYSIKTKKEKLIKSFDHHITTDIYNEEFIYNNLDLGGHNIYLYNLTTGDERLIISDKSADCLYYCIYEDKIVYIKGKLMINGQAKNPKIVLYDLATEKEEVIAEPISIGRAEISMHNNIIVWTEESEDHKYSVMYYNITTGEKKRLPIDWQLFAETSVYNDTIVFTGAVNETTGGIAGYDLLTDTYFSISTANGLMMSPHLYKNRVVWIDWRNSPRPAQLLLIQPNEIWSAEIKR